MSLTDKDNWAIKWNNLAANERCIICDERTDPRVGWEVTYTSRRSSGAQSFIPCYPCQKKYVPELAEACQLANNLFDNTPDNPKVTPKVAEDVLTVKELEIMVRALEADLNNKIARVRLNGFDPTFGSHLKTVD